MLSLWLAGAFLCVSAQDQHETKPIEREEQPVGEYGQPDWTRHRRFPTTRVYVQTPPETVEFEQWAEIREPRQGHSETRFREEIEFGLGERFQLDLYLNTHQFHEDDEKKFELMGFSAELRWALANWGEIFGNPTLYFEYLYMDKDPDKIEPKLLLGGALSPRWHWGVNVIYEMELVGRRERDEEWAVTSGLSYSLIDQKLGIGAEFRYVNELEREGGAAERTEQCLLGPSLQFRFLDRASLSLAPLFGLTRESRALQMFVVFTWRF